MTRRVGQTVMQVERRHTSGPIPSPDQLKEYDEVVPGTAERIISQMLIEGDHRREMEKRELETFRDSHTVQLAQRGRGQHYGLAVAILCGGLSALAMLLGFPGTAATIASGVMVTLTTVFVTNSRAKSQVVHDGNGSE